MILIFSSQPEAGISIHSIWIFVAFSVSMTQFFSAADLMELLSGTAITKVSGSFTMGSPSALKLLSASAAAVCVSLDTVSLPASLLSEAPHPPSMVPPSITALNISAPILVNLFFIYLPPFSFSQYFVHYAHQLYLMRQSYRHFCIPYISYI